MGWEPIGKKTARGIFLFLLSSFLNAGRYNLELDNGMHNSPGINNIKYNYVMTYLYLSRNDDPNLVYFP